jgi:hypothetical protein
VFVFDRIIAVVLGSDVQVSNSPKQSTALLAFVAQTRSNPDVTKQLILFFDLRDLDDVEL